MLDIKFIRENPKLVEEKSVLKGYSPNIKKLLEVDKQRRKLIEEVDSLRGQRKEAAEKRDEQEGTKLKEVLKVKENEMDNINDEFYSLVRQVPNLPKDDVPEGRDENDDHEIKAEGKIPKFGFVPKDHVELGNSNDLLDIDRAVKVSGSRFYYLKNELVSLEFAIINFTFETLKQEGFIPVVPPVIINKKAAEGLGYPEYETGEGYKVDGQFLVGTAEHSIVPMHMDETLEEKSLPLRYAAFSTAFRKEAGSYGKDTKGIIRAHQFDKVEMVSFVLPEDEDKEHQFLLSIEEKMVQAFKLPYRVVNKCTGELGFPTARKYDIEIYLPSQGKYRETHSASTNSDFQARRLNIKYQKGAEKGFVYILNATAFAIGRTLIAIMENYQAKDGSILIPQVLQKYTGFKKIPA